MDVFEKDIAGAAGMGCQRSECQSLAIIPGCFLQRSLFEEIFPKEMNAAENRPPDNSVALCYLLDRFQVQFIQMQLYLILYCR
jgi:hypothetical protein